jgi:hypothetical protein
MEADGCANSLAFVKSRMTDRYEVRREAMAQTL